MTVKDGKRCLGYGYLLNLVFDHFGIGVGKGVKGTIKQAFSQPLSLNVCVLREELTISSSYMYLIS